MHPSFLKIFGLKEFKKKSKEKNNKIKSMKKERKFNWKKD